jgi:uncharacterized phage-associated protein
VLKFLEYNKHKADARIRKREKMKTKGTMATTEGTQEEKLKELIVLLSELSEGDEYFGQTKLNKLLFYSDFLSYILHGKSISGHTYEARPQGPMLRGFYKIRDSMLGKDIALAKRDFGRYPQEKTLALRSADVKRFTPEEVNLINHIVNDFRGVTASQISALSHEFLGWQAVEVGEEIPYEIALVSTEDLSEEEWAFPEHITVNLDKIGIKETDVLVHASQNV